LFAALNVAAGKIIAQCQPRHRHQEFLRFLKQIDTATDLTLEAGFQFLVKTSGSLGTRYWPSSTSRLAVR
jgi:hypothetical protein